MKPTRKTRTRWMESRLRRLTFKIGDGPNNPSSFYCNDLSPESIARCEIRAEQLQRMLRDPGLEAELSEAAEKASVSEREPDKFLGRSQEHSSDEPEVT